VNSSVVAVAIIQDVGKSSATTRTRRAVNHRNPYRTLATANRKGVREHVGLVEVAAYEFPFLASDPALKSDCVISSVILFRSRNRVLAPQ
jgi:hypothetical protein